MSIASRHSSGFALGNTLCALSLILALPACLIVDDNPNANNNSTSSVSGPGTTPNTNDLTTSAGSSAKTTSSSGSTDGTESKSNQDTSGDVAEVIKGACANTLGVEMPERCETLAFSRPIEGMHNFREFTQPLHSSTKILAKKVYRADAMYKVSEKGLATLRGMGIKTIIDLRAEEEIVEHPDISVPGVRQWLNFPIGQDPDNLAKLGLTQADADEIKRMFLAGDFAGVDKFLQDKNLDIEKLRVDRYKEFAFSFKESMAATLRVFADPAAYPVVFHCQGGKDRTGYVASVLQRIAGWDIRDVERDYISTNFFTYDHLVPMYESGVMSLRPIFGAHLTQIRGAHAAVDEKYPVFEDYLKLELGLSAPEIEAIRKNLTTP